MRGQIVRPIAAIQVVWRFDQPKYAAVNSCKQSESACVTLISIHIAISRHVSGTTSAMRIAGWRRLVVWVRPCS